MERDPQSVERWLPRIATLAAIALLAKLAFAFFTIGTNDVRTWEANLHVIRTQGGPALYHAPVPLYEDGKVAHTQVYNHPPLMISVIRFWGWLEDQTSIPFRTWLRLTASLADLGTLLLLYLGAASGRWALSGPALCVLAASPVCLFISGFHGNTDPVMLFFLAASVYALECRDNVIASGLLLGLAMEIKIPPVILVPAILLSLRSFRKCLVWSAAAALTAGLPVLPYLDSGKDMARNILGYGSSWGQWGFSFIHLALDLPHPYAANQALKAAMFGSIVLLALWCSRRSPRTPLFEQCGASFFLFLTFAPGFGIQYLAWLAPWPAVLGLRPMLSYHTIAGGFIAIIYTYWSGGLPWYYANAFTRAWHGWMQIPQLATWLTVSALALLFVLRARPTHFQAVYARGS